MSVYDQVFARKGDQFIELYSGTFWYHSEEVFGRLPWEKIRELQVDRCYERIQESLDKYAEMRRDYARRREEILEMQGVSLDEKIEELDRIHEVLAEIQETEEDLTRIRYYLNCWEEIGLPLYIGEECGEAVTVADIEA